MRVMHTEPIWQERRVGIARVLALSGRKLYEGDERDDKGTTQHRYRISVPELSRQ